MKMFISMNYAFIAYRIGFNLSLIVFFPSLSIFFKENGFPRVVSLIQFFFASSFVCYSSLSFYSSFRHFIAAFLLQSTGEYLIFSFRSFIISIYMSLYTLFFFYHFPLFRKLRWIELLLPYVQSNKTTWIFFVS